MDSLYNRPNKVPQMQRLFQSNPSVPVYMKTSRSKLMLYPFFAIMGGGLLGSMYGLTRMARSVENLVYTWVQTTGDLRGEAEDELAIESKSISRLGRHFCLAEGHRRPTLSLYRALLRKCHRLEEPLATTLDTAVKKKFASAAGKGLRNPFKIREALETGYAAHDLLVRALAGDVFVLDTLRARFPARQKTVPAKQGAATITRPMSTILPTELSPNGQREIVKKKLVKEKPIKPPYLSWDALKQPFLRPRHRKHNQTQSMILRNRTRQHQKRIDRMTDLQWGLLYAKAEEDFTARLGLDNNDAGADAGGSDGGYVDEVRLAITRLQIDQDEAELRKLQRWEHLESLHDRLVNEYDVRMKEWGTSRKATT